MVISSEERSILVLLDSTLHAEGVGEEIDKVVTSVRLELQRKPGAVMAWKPLPLNIYRRPLPGVVRSSWVFILRAGINTGAERHPNSHQRMMSYTGVGDLQLRRDESGLWESNILSNDPSTPLEKRWISIPINVWHQPVVPTGQDWVVVSFHTVHAEELIEERPHSNGGIKQMVYLAADQ